MSGRSFGEAYLKDVKQANRQDLTGEKQEASSARNTQIKQFAQQEESTDQKHAEDADTLKSEG